MTRQPCTNADGSPKRLYKSKSGAQRAARRTNHDGGRDTHFHVGHPKDTMR